MFLTDYPFYLFTTCNLLDRYLLNASPSTMKLFEPLKKKYFSKVEIAIFNLAKELQSRLTASHNLSSLISRSSYCATVFKHIRGDYQHLQVNKLISISAWGNSLSVQLRSECRPSHSGHHPLSVRLLYLSCFATFSSILHYTVSRIVCGCVSF
jgi:hypothetical protein